MTIRSEKYPLDVSIRYPESAIDSSLSPLLPAYRRPPNDGLVYNPQINDLTNLALHKYLLYPMWINTVKTLAYCDVIDLAQETAANAQQDAAIRIAALEGEVASLRTSIDKLIAFFGVTIPAWSNKDEVENGDDMGMDIRSAAELGILVAFEFVRQQLGFGHEDVVSIDPPAGTFIARGTTVKVTLNLLG